MQKKLPINTSPYIETECWMYHKLCIIQTSKKSSAWLASNFGIFMNEDYRVLFGKNNNILGMSDFNDILTFREINYWETPPSRILDVVLESINSQKYLIIYLMIDVKTHSIHEYLIYGYDLDKKLLYTTVLRKGHFVEEAVSFCMFLHMYKNLYDYNLTYPDNIIDNFFNFFPITSVALNDTLDEKLCFVESLRRFQDEKDGKILSLHPKTNNNNNIYCGIQCLIGLKKRIGEYIKDKKYIDKNLFKTLSAHLYMNFKKVHEHSNIVYSSMIWILDNLQFTEDRSCLKKYKHYIDLLQQLVFLSLKFEYSEDWSNLYNINETMDTLYELAYSALDSFFVTCYSARKQYNTFAYNNLLKNSPKILEDRHYFKD